MSLLTKKFYSSIDPDEITAKYQLLRDKITGKGYIICLLATSYDETVEVIIVIEPNANRRSEKEVEADFDKNAYLTAMLDMGYKKLPYFDVADLPKELNVWGVI